MNLKLPAGDFRAYLFDCDGTIADSMPLHYKAWKKALAEYGATYEEELFYAWGGKPVRKIIADLNEMQGLTMPVDVLAARKESFYHAQLPELKGIPDVLEVIETKYGQIPFAVVSGSRRASVVRFRSRRLVCSTGSPSSFAPKTTRTANLPLRDSCLLRRSSA